MISHRLELPTCQDGLNKTLLGVALEAVAETQHPLLVAEDAAAAVINKIKMPTGVFVHARSGFGTVVITCTNLNMDTRQTAVPAWYQVNKTIRVGRALFDILMESIDSICDMSDYLLQKARMS